ncbi:hypothetical protein SYNPS1DRAFT_27264 [Syncephalis pseudoplumigaleata]|uniref:Uncharacterized protein n=1 Tax=Syncephalis pseudoplumigaleata TaxID=1712513 RepID=A0A4V1J224_9FUNG|nr:hypothetical protein SYNPS1DRAFT_27264 [Syncephalis pseudoplumigaleata]|eukprot:RKP27069.1 hypothetical protein SYNPS1DRAFT_27264 [Syncephalis pseudoplumigaleata]
MNQNVDDLLGGSLNPQQARLYTFPHVLYLIMTLIVGFYAVAIVAFYLLALDTTLFLTARVRGVLGSRIADHAEPGTSGEHAARNERPAAGQLAGKGVIEVTTMLKPHVKYPSTDVEFQRKPSPLSPELQFTYEWLTWVLIVSILIAIAGVMARIVYVFKRHVGCGFGRYWISICQGLSHGGFMLVVVWCQQHGYGRCFTIALLQLLTGILTVVFVVIVPIPFNENNTVAGICIYTASVATYEHLVAAGFIGFSSLMIINVIAAIYYLPPDIDDIIGSEEDENGEGHGALPNVVPVATRPRRLDRLSPAKRYRSLRKKRRSRVHRYRRAHSLEEAGASLAPLDDIQRIASLEERRRLSGASSWLSHPMSDLSPRPAGRRVAQAPFSYSSLPSMFPVDGSFHSIYEPLLWIPIPRKYAFMGPGSLLRTFTRHSVLVSDALAGVTMITIGLTYTTDIWLRFTNLPIVITWITLCYAALNSFRYWHRRDIRLARLHSISRVTRPPGRARDSMATVTGPFEFPPDGNAANATLVTSPSSIEVPIEVSEPVAPARRQTLADIPVRMDMASADRSPSASMHTFNAEYPAHSQAVDNGSRDNNDHID